MKHVHEQATLARIFVGEADQHQGRPLFEAIVHKARDMELAGATVLRGVEGFGKSGVLHSARLLRVAEDLPLVIEIVDADDRLAPFLRVVEQMLDEARCTGLITSETVRIVRFEP